MSRSLGALTLLLALLPLTQGVSGAAGCPAGMSRIPGGILPRQPAPVEITPFCLQRTEVTVAEYARCVEAGSCEPAHTTVQVPGTSPEDLALWSRSCNWGEAGREGHPVNCLTRDQARTYCAFLGGRLPTDPEWEWAARGGDEARAHPWGDRPPRMRLLNVCGAECVERFQRLGRAWRLMHYGDDGWPTTAPVGSFPEGVGRWDLLDLAGNVWEMTVDEAAGEERIRGGGWAQTDPDWVRTDRPGGFPLGARGSAVGFRCAAPAQSPPA